MFIWLLYILKIYKYIFMLILLIIIIFYYSFFVFTSLTHWVLVTMANLCHSEKSLNNVTIKRFNINKCGLQTPIPHPKSNICQTLPNSWESQWTKTPQCASVLYAVAVKSETRCPTSNCLNTTVSIQRKRLKSVECWLCCLNTSLEREGKRALLFKWRTRFRWNGALRSLVLVTDEAVF